MEHSLEIKIFTVLSIALTKGLHLLVIDSHAYICCLHVPWYNLLISQCGLFEIFEWQMYTHVYSYTNGNTIYTVIRCNTTCQKVELFIYNSGRLYTKTINLNLCRLVNSLCNLRITNCAKNTFSAIQKNNKPDTFKI